MTYVKPGDHVITCLSAFCGHCEACTTGHPSICDGRETLCRRDQPARLYQEERTVQQFANLSSFAEQMLIHEHALVKIRDDMPRDKAALIGCGVTTGVGAVHNTVKVEVGLTVTVIGMMPYGTKVEIHAADFLKEKKLLGCAMGSNRFRVDMPRYVDFCLAGRLKLDDLLEDHIKLEQVNEAFNASKTGEVARKVIVFNHLV